MSTGATAKLLRSWSQRAFISGRESWDEISPARRFQWESFAKAMAEEGYLLADPTVVAAMQQIVDQASAYAAIPGPWIELEIVRAFLAPPHGPAGTRSGLGGTGVRELVAKAIHAAMHEFECHTPVPPNDWDTLHESHLDEYRLYADAVISCLGLAGAREGGTTGVVDSGDWAVIEYVLTNAKATAKGTVGGDIRTALQHVREYRSCIEKVW